MPPGMIPSMAAGSPPGATPTMPGGYLRSREQGPGESRARSCRYWLFLWDSLSSFPSPKQRRNLRKKSEMLTSDSRVTKLSPGEALGCRLCAAPGQSRQRVPMPHWENRCPEGASFPVASGSASSNDGRGDFDAKGVASLAG